MRKVLIELWNGNLSPVAYSGKGEPEIENLIRLMERNQEELSDLLDHSQRQTLEKLLLCIDEYESFITEQAFCDGFSLGCKLLTEAFMAKTPM